MKKSNNIQRTGEIPKADRLWLAKGVGRTRTLKDINGGNIKINGKEFEYTAYDFDNMGCFTGEELKDIIENNIGIFLDTEEGLDELNRYYRTAVEEIFQKSAFKRIYDMKLKEEGKKLNYQQVFREFKSKDEAILFLENAGKKELGIEGELKCLMSKIISSVAENIKYEKEEELIKRKQEIVELIEGCTSCRKVGRTIRGNINGYEFYLNSRLKNITSRVAKSLGQPEYCSAQDSLDNQGFKITPISEKVSTKQLIELAINFKKLLLGLENCNIIKLKIKGMKLSDEEMKLLKQHFKNITNEKKPGTPDEYKELKFTLKYGGLGTEFQFTPLENENQKGLKFHSIYSYLQKQIIGYITRHSQLRYVTDKDIKLIVEDFFNNLQELLNKTKEREGTSKEEYCRELFGELQKFKLENGKTAIQKGVKFENKTLEKNIQSFLIPGLVKYFKTKLVKMKLPSGITVFTSQRSKILIDYKFPEEIEREDIL